MKKLWGHKESVCAALLVKDADGIVSPESQAIHDLCVTMMNLFDDVTEVLLALDWDHDRSEELENKFRKWRDHIQDGFGQHVRMPDGSTFMSCMPVHYTTEGHLRTHASKLYRAHKIAIGVLTDQASEQYNQLVKHDVTCGH